MTRKILIAIFTVLMLVSFALFGVLGFKLLSEGFPGVGSHFDPKATYYDLTVDVTDGGSVNTTQGKFEKDQVVNLSATVEDGYVFMGWYDEHDNYITSSLNYTFAMEGKTKLYAKFCLEPENFEGTASYYEELKGVSTDFSFTIQSDKSKEWLEENLKIVDEDYIDLIGTEHEDDVTVKFDVEDLGNGTFKITPKEAYEEGTTYTVFLVEEADGDIAIQEDMDQGESLTFSTEKENGETAEVKEEGIIYISMQSDVISLYDDGKTEGEEGDVIDKVIINTDKNVEKDDIICIYSGATDGNGKPVIDNNTLFGKVKSVSALGGRYEITYGTPDVSEIFSDLDIYLNQEVNFENAGATIATSMAEEIKYAFLAQEGFQEFVASAENAVKEAVKGTGLEVEPLTQKSSILDAIAVDVNSQITGNKIVLTINVSLMLDLINNGSKVATVEVELFNEKSINVTTNVNYKIKEKKGEIAALNSYDFGVESKTEDQYTFAINVKTEEGQEDLVKKEVITEKALKGLKKVKNGEAVDKVKEMFDLAGYSATDKKAIDVTSFTFNSENVSADILVKFFIEFDIAGSVYYSTKATNYTRMGVRSSGKNSVVYYEVNGTEKASEVAFAGQNEIKSGSVIEVVLNVTGLAKYVRANLQIESGLTVISDGYVSTGSGLFAGNFESRVFANGKVDYKVFDTNITEKRDSKEKQLVNVGYVKVITDWTESKKLSKNNYELSIIEKETNLFDIDDLRINVMNKSGNVKSEKVKWDSNFYNVIVTFAKGENVSYSNGKLIVKEGAPAYFEDVIKISITGENKWDKVDKDKYYVTAPTIEIKLTYGNEDAYYESTDSDIEKSFRNMYRSYNEANVEVLKEMINNLIDGALGEEVEDIVVFDVLVNEYINALFDTIKAYKEVEDDKRTMENKFVYGEAGIYKESMAWINSMLDEEEFSREDFREILIDMAETDVLYKTLVAIKDHEKFEEFASKFNLKVDKEAELIEDLDWFVENAENADKAQKIKEVMYEVFGLGEDEE